MKTTDGRLQTKHCRKAAVSSPLEFAERGEGNETERKQYVHFGWTAKQSAHVS